MAAGIAALELIRDAGVWEQLEARALQLQQGLATAASRAGIAICQTRVGTMFTTFFGSLQPRDWSSVKQADTERFGAFFRLMLDRGIYLAPSQFEAGFLSIQHDEKIIAGTIAAAESAFQAL